MAEVIARLILARPEISFKLIHNGKQVYSSSGSGDLRSAVFCLYGREIAHAMLPVRSEGAVSVSGLVGVGLQARSNRARQTFIVNGRTIRSALLTQALEEGCRERVTVGHYPICVLNIQMPVNMVDVNVHPNKLEVRFSDEHLIYQHVKDAVADGFAVSPLDSAPKMMLTDEKPAAMSSSVRVIDTEHAEGIAQAKREIQKENASQESEKPAVKVHVLSVPASEKVSEPAASETASRPSIKQHTDFSSFVTQYFGGNALRESVIPGRPRNQTPSQERDLIIDSAKTADPMEVVSAKRESKADTTVKKQESAPKAPGQPEPVQENLFAHESKDSLGPALEGYAMLGVAFDTYIILQNDKQMIFVDQHAAHERILYEKLMREIDAGVGSQMLMVAQVVHVTPQDRAKIEMYAEEIRAAGFDIEPFGDDAYQIRAVPNVLGIPQSKAAFLEMVDRLGELRVLSTQQKRRDAILQMACKKAIKGGDKLTMDEIRPLLADMLASNAPPTCPHGRPLVVILTRSELEKRFRRINT